jgi:hypothetical protein
VRILHLWLVVAAFYWGLRPLDHAHPRLRAMVHGGRLRPAGAPRQTDPPARCRLTRALFFKAQQVPVFTYERDRQTNWYVFRVLNNHDQTAWRVVFHCMSDRTGRPKKITVKDRYTGAIDYEIPPGETVQLDTSKNLVIGSGS